MTIIVSHSELESAQRCGLQHQLGYVERWRKPKAESTAAGIGTLWHSVLQAHYQVLSEAQGENAREGRDWNSYKDFEKTKAAANFAATEVIVNAQDPEVQVILEWMYEGYVEQYQLDSEWRVMAVEHFGLVPLVPTNKELLKLPRLIEDVENEHLFGFKFFADLVVMIDGRVWLVDHKSVHNMPKNVDIDLDTQFDRYTWAMRQQGVNVMGQIHSYSRRRMTQREQTLDERFQRELTRRSQIELDAIADEMFLAAYYRYQQHFALEAAGVDAPRSLSSRHCNFLCDYTAGCVLGRKGADMRGFFEETGFQPKAERNVG